MIPHEVLAAHDFTQVTARLVRMLNGNAVAALVLTRISWRLAPLADGSWWRANFEQIADETGLTARQVKRAVAALEQAAHLEVMTELVDGPWDRTQSYRIAWADEPGTIRSEDPGTVRSEGGSTLGPNGPTDGTIRSEDPGTIRSDVLCTKTSKDLDKARLTRVTARQPEPTELFPVERPEPAITAGALVGEWIDQCQHPPPARVKGQIARLIRELLDEGIDPEHIRAGIADWMTRDVHPGVLPSIINNLMNGKQKPSSRDAEIKKWQTAGTSILQRRLEIEP